jgi:hypothetical protein
MFTTSAMALVLIIPKTLLLLLTIINENHKEVKLPLCFNRAPRHEGVLKE